MLPLSSTVIDQKNDLHSTDAIILLLELDIPSVIDPLRLARNNSDVSWNGHTWVAFPFDMDEINDTTTGEIPQVAIQIANASRAIEAYLIEYDTWLKLNSHRPIIATIRIVSTADLVNTTPVASFVFEVSHFKTTAATATFFLAQKNIYSLRFPPNRASRKCRWRFGSVECGVVALPGQTCNKTLSDCRSFSNSVRFGGFPSVGGALEKVYVE